MHSSNLVGRWLLPGVTCSRHPSPKWPHCCLLWDRRLGRGGSPRPRRRTRPTNQGRRLLCRRTTGRTMGRGHRGQRRRRLDRREGGGKPTTSQGTSTRNTMMTLSGGGGEGSRTRHVKDERRHQLNKQQSAINGDAWGEGGKGTMTTITNCGRGSCAEALMDGN